ncbi:TetR/AcrR family transcriptional regulator [Agrobacterium sp.]|uniref:TetR/AcrR family transcriptional regulator n=1 Tax=Agrobacterium sp. TaxID=361 RepID=UPI0028AB7750|nr:TetR/AcrR family transcriptional regulator [Agrobacterium sp.]
MTESHLITLDDYLGSAGVGPRRIIDAAAALFRRRGFIPVSMIEVAQAVGLSKPGLYHHWPNKEALLQVIARLSGELLLRQIDDVRKNFDDPEQRMRAYVRTRLEIVAHHQDLFTVTWQERALLSSASFGELSRMAERYRQEIRQLIDEAKQAGFIRKDADTHLLMLALDGMTGWAYFWYRESGDLAPDQIGDAFWNMLAHGVVQPAKA